MAISVIKQLCGKPKFSSITELREIGREVLIRFADQRYLDHEVSIRIAGLLQEMEHLGIKVEKFFFTLVGQDQKTFNFTLENSDHRNTSAALNGSMSAILTKREAKELIDRSGQRNNNCSSKTVIYGFRPEDPSDANYTIFFLKDLESCVVALNPEIL